MTASYGKIRCSEYNSSFQNLKLGWGNGFSIHASEKVCQLGKQCVSTRCTRWRKQNKNQIISESSRQVHRLGDYGGTVSPRVPACHGTHNKPFFVSGRVRGSAIFENLWLEFLVLFSVVSALGSGYHHRFQPWQALRPGLLGQTPLTLGVVVGKQKVWQKVKWKLWWWKVSQWKAKVKVRPSQHPKVQMKMKWTHATLPTQAKAKVNWQGVVKVWCHPPHKLPAQVQLPHCPAQVRLTQAPALHMLRYPARQQHQVEGKEKQAKETRSMQNLPHHPEPWGHLWSHLLPKDHLWRHMFKPYKCDAVIRSCLSGQLASCSRWHGQKAHRAFITLTIVKTDLSCEAWEKLHFRIDGLWPHGPSGYGSAGESWRTWTRQTGTYLNCSQYIFQNIDEIDKDI